ncbi:MAG: hypothetical protein HND48_13675 [Chloroflexi bacterium]|nr:hypothetical protein [Chloroflexota bacterium]
MKSAISSELLKALRNPSDDLRAGGGAAQPAVRPLRCRPDYAAVAGGTL